MKMGKNQRGHIEWRNDVEDEEKKGKRLNRMLSEWELVAYTTEIMWRVRVRRNVIKNSVQR